MASKFGTRYAVVASTVALVLALGGTAYAVATIDSSDVVDNSLQSVDVRNNTLASADVHDGTLRRADLAANQVSPRLFAVYNGNTSTLLASAGVTSAVRDGLGDYRVTFNRNVANCSWLASTGGRNNSTFSTDNRIVTANNITADPNTVHVAAGLGGFATDMTFNLAVVC